MNVVHQRVPSLLTVASTVWARTQLGTNTNRCVKRLMLVMPEVARRARFTTLPFIAVTVIGN